MMYLLTHSVGKVWNFFLQNIMGNKNVERVEG